MHGTDRLVTLGTALNLQTIDLNLLVVLDALVSERSVGRAGERLGLSQSATSHALERLRRMTGDELLVRCGTRMDPTPRALSLAGPVRQALQDIRAALQPTSFQPENVDQEFVLVAETYETIIVLPRLVQSLRQDAPNVQLTARTGATDDILAGLDSGQIDVGVGLFHALPDRFMTCGLFTDDYVCAMRADHALAGTPLTLDSYIEAAHLLISVSQSGGDAIDGALAVEGRRRRILMHMPHGLAAIIALMRSDLVTTVTRGAASIFMEVAPLKLMELPFKVPGSAFRLVWSRRMNTTPGHIWFRRKIVASVAGYGRAGGVSLPDSIG